MPRLSRGGVSVATAVETVELLRFHPESPRTSAFLSALKTGATSSGVRLNVSDHYRGASDLLMLWGPGAPNRWPAMQKQLAAGGHVAALDLAYWNREDKFRVSIDAAHPQAWVMRKEWPRARLVADRVSIGDVWNPQGPVILAGLGEKARVQYVPQTVDDWEAAMIATVRAAGRELRYRAKRPGRVPAGVPSTGDGPIETVLRGASCIITWHSNVAVDAIRLGIPVVCRDGAAAAVCGSTYVPTLEPLDPALRDRFLSNLAWFQWRPDEVKSCWKWMRELLA